MSELTGEGDNITVAKLVESNAETTRSSGLADMEAKSLDDSAKPEKETTCLTEKNQVKIVEDPKNVSDKDILRSTDVKAPEISSKTPENESSMETVPILATSVSNIDKLDDSNTKIDDTDSGDTNTSKTVDPIKKISNTDDNNQELLQKENLHNVTSSKDKIVKEVEIVQDKDNIVTKDEIVKDEDGKDEDEKAEVTVSKVIDNKTIETPVNEELDDSAEFKLHWDEDGAEINLSDEAYQKLDVELGIDDEVKDVDGDKTQSGDEKLDKDKKVGSGDESSEKAEIGDVIKENVGEKSNVNIPEKIDKEMDNENKDLVTKETELGAENSDLSDSVVSAESINTVIEKESLDTSKMEDEQIKEAVTEISEPEKAVESHDNVDKMDVDPEICEPIPETNAEIIEDGGNLEIIDDNIQIDTANTGGKETTSNNKNSTENTTKITESTKIFKDVIKMDVEPESSEVKNTVTQAQEKPVEVTNKARTVEVVSEKSITETLKEAKKQKNIKSKKATEKQYLKEIHRKIAENIKFSNMNVGKAPEKSMGMKKNSGFIDPDVMIEIPTQELFNIVNFDLDDESLLDDDDDFDYSKEDSSPMTDTDVITEIADKAAEDKDKIVMSDKIAANKDDLVTKADQIAESSNKTVKKVDNKDEIVTKSDQKDKSFTVTSKSNDKPAKSETVTDLESSSKTAEVSTSGKTARNEPVKDLKDIATVGKDISSGDKEISGDDEVQEITDSLGLLAESSRVMDDDDGDEIEDDDDAEDDDDDFDQDDESSNLPTADHSEDSNTHSETDTVKDGVKGTTVPASERERDDNIAEGMEIGEEGVGNEIQDKTLTPEKNSNIEPKDASGREKAENIQDVESSKLRSILSAKDPKTPTKESPAKTSRLGIAKQKNVLNFVELDESSSDESEVSKMDTESTEAVSENVDVSDTTERISTPKKSAGPKMTKLNTSEISIKTGTTTKPPLIIPEIGNIPETSTEPDTVKPKPKKSVMALEVFNLDSDDDETGSKSNPDKVTDKPRTKCVNSMCATPSEALYVADVTVAAYYGVTKRSSICGPCLEMVKDRMQNLIEGIKNMTPLFELDMGKPTCQLVEISDSESEGEEVASEGAGEVIGSTGASIIEDKLAELFNETWIKYNMDDRLKETEDIVLDELKKIEEQGNELDKVLKDCQIETDRIRKELYLTFEPERKTLNTVIIHDTPVGSFTCLEDDLVQPDKASMKRRFIAANELPSKKFAATPLPISTNITKNTQDMDTSQTVDSKLDDDKDISVVRLSAEAAPADLPPPGEVLRPALKPGVFVYAMRNAFGAWLKGKVLDILPKTPGQAYTQCRIKFDLQIKNPCKVLPARCLAYPDPSEVRMTIGTRVIALFKDNNVKTESFYSGVVAEVPNPVNNYRYLVFFDDGYAQYVRHGDTRVVCECSPLVWEEVHHFIRDFVCNYLLSYPERPMVRLHAGQKLKTEWNGKWWASKVLQVDASLAHVHFEEDDRTEWIYRGSTRLAPLYLELRNAQRHRHRAPTTKAQARTNMPYVEYTRHDEQPSKNQESQEQQQQNVEEMRRQRAVAKKSTALPQPQPAPAHPLDGVISRVVYYTPKNAVRPLKMTPHQCSPKCKRTDVLSLKDLRTYNPLAKPLLSGWERQLVRHKGQRTVAYRAPCGRRIRDVRELHQYLRRVRSDMPVDLFDFNVATHCLAEFVLNKVAVMKKDLSNGKENVPVPCVNYYDDSLPEFCSYNTERTPTAGVPLNLDPEFLCGCDCDDDCQDKSKCACWKMTLEGARTIGLEGPNVGYVYRRLPEPLPSGIYECNSRCKCKSTCLNRVAQQPLQLKLQVFKTLNRGWGIRALNDVPKGSFLCVYAGNLLTDATANLDGLNEGDEYLAELDYIEVVEQMKEGYEEDIPEEDKKLDKKESKKSGEESSTSESEEEEYETNDNVEEDCDFQPGHIGMGLTEFNKRLRIRDKKNKEESAQKEAEKGTQKNTDDCITISDDEEVREPSRFTAQAGMGDKDFVSKYRSVRTLFGKDEACYIMDAKVQGNIGRYLNHSCQPNVFVQNVFVDTHDPRFPWVAFFALSHVRAGAELTWNYNYDVGSVPGKVLYCYCGAANCRGRLL